MCRADYAVKESPDRKKDFRYQSFTEKAQNFLREQSDDSDPTAYSGGGESTQYSDDVDPFTEKIQIKETEKVRVVNEFGDDMTDLLWDGPEDSDEEVEELLPFKTAYEQKQGIKFSKNGIIKYIEEMLAKENPNNESEPKTAALWENHMKETAFKLHLKKGGSQFNKDQPYIRLDTNFNHKFKMDRLVKTVSILFMA